MPEKKEVLVRVHLPRATGSEEETLFVALNGKGYTIRRGEDVDVPKPVADILAEAERQQARQEAYIRSRQQGSGAL